MAVALYASVSTATQAEKELSIPDQIRQMRDWYKAQGHSVAMDALNGVPLLPTTSGQYFSRCFGCDT